MQAAATASNELQQYCFARWSRSTTLGLISTGLGDPLCVQVTLTPSWYLINSAWLSLRGRCNEYQLKL